MSLEREFESQNIGRITVKNMLKYTLYLYKFAHPPQQPLSHKISPNIKKETITELMKCRLEFDNDKSLTLYNKEYDGKLKGKRIRWRIMIIAHHIKTTELLLGILIKPNSSSKTLETTNICCITIS